jgi:hypothetical protein
MRRPARTAAVTARRLDGNGSTSRPRGRPTSCMEAASPMRWCGTTGGACHPSAGDPVQDSEYGTRRCLGAGRSVRRPLTRGLRAAATKSRGHRCSRWPRPFRQPGLRFREDPRVGGCSQIRGFPDRRGDFTEYVPGPHPQPSRSAPLSVVLPCGGGWSYRGLTQAPVVAGDELAAFGVALSTLPKRAHADFLAERGGHYLFTVKGNQPLLRAAAATALGTRPRGASPWQRTRSPRVPLGQGHRPGRH